MIIRINEYSDVPIYLQIRNQIVMGISSGELAAGEQLPTVRALSMEIGINTMGKAHLKVESTDSSESEDSTATDSTPVNFTAYLGGEYNFEVNDEIGVGVGLGIDMMLGKQSAESDDKANGRIGVGMKAVGKYAINKQFEVSLGAKYSIYFINTGSETEATIPYMIKATEETAKLSGASFSHFQSGLKIFAGCTYTL